MKKFVLILLAMMLCLSGITNVFAENYEKTKIKDYDNAPAIGEFRYDSEYAAKIAEKERRSKAYYEAKMYCQ